MASFPEGQFHKSTYQAGYDLHFSPYAGGEDILFLHRLLERAEGLCVAKTSLVYSPSVQARFFRFTEWFLGWLPLDYLAMVAQHEVFGHGYRIRDINRGRAYVDGYEFGVPIPFDSGGGATSYSVGENLTTTEETSISMAGVEATGVLALLTKLKWVESGYINPRQVALYLLSQFDLTLYIDSLDVKNDPSLDGHDIFSYIRTLNYTYTKKFLHQSILHKLIWINLADPFAFLSAYCLCRYILFAKEASLPLFLANLRLGLTPFGPEIWIDNFLSKSSAPIYFYLRGGNHSSNSYGGLGLLMPRLSSIHHFRLGFRLDGWWQPKLLLYPPVPFSSINFNLPPDPTYPLYPYSEQNQKRIGGSGSLLIAYHGKSGFQAEVGYKTAGFLPGYSLRAAPILRLFYTWIF